MADTCCKSVAPSLRFLSVSLAGLVFAALAGCVDLGSVAKSHSSEPPPLPPPQPVNWVMTIWDGSLRFAQDTMHDGVMLPGLAGRVWLVNEDIKDMVDAGGSIHVAIVNKTPGAPANQPYYAVKCEFKELDLKLLKRKDMVGNGYTLFVPWETYRPDIQQIEVQVCYAPRGGTLQYSAPTPIALRAENSFPIDRRQVVFAPGQPQQQLPFGPPPRQAYGPPQPQVFVPGQAPQQAFGPAPQQQMFAPAPVQQPQAFLPGQAPPPQVFGPVPR